MGEDGLKSDPRFADAAARKANDAALAALLEAAFRKHSAKDWFALLDTAGVPCEVCASDFSLGMYEDPEMIERRLVAAYDHPYVGRLNQIGLAFDLSETPAVIQRPPLIVGDSTEEILREIGYSADAIAELLRERAIMAWSRDSDPNDLSFSWAPKVPAQPASKGDAVAAE
jgi:crotonobetainyl-CoA:carnitine CoA-transferase CaiB-like acyl-CoA transferase